ncbi:unnamed protein product [Amoebophrya sp. A25]|nr:unnamed protein product [Amoebophrya sp. A25]|eukprot:GSA25T00023019001.1
MLESKISSRPAPQNRKMRAALLAVSSASALVAASATEQTPIQKVVGLLQQMAQNLEDEKKKDGELYSDLQCWCKTNIKDKTKAIAGGKAAAKTLEGEIFEEAGKVGEYESNAKNAKKKVAKLEQTLADSEEQCEASMKDMRQEEAELASTVAALDNALKILGKHQSLLQTNPEVVSALQTTLHITNQKARIMYGKDYSSNFGGKSFLQASTGAEAKLGQALSGSFRPVLDEASASSVLGAFVQKAGHLGKYQSGSGQVFGILNSMKDEFSADLAELQKKIETETKACKELKTTTTAQLDASRKNFEEFTAKAGKAKFLGTEGKEELKKIRAQVDADTAVLLEVKDQCTNIDVDMKLRTEARDAEIEAVGKALEILTSDETRAALQPSAFGFVQVAARTSSSEAKRGKAARVLQHTLDSLPSWDEVSMDLQSAKIQSNMNTQKAKLALIAQSVRLDAFTKVKEMIDNLVADIKAQMALDVKTRDGCTVNIQTNEKETVAAKRDQQLGEEKIASLVEQIAKIDTDVVAEKESLADTLNDMKKAETEREAGNAEFQKTVNEQRAMQKVLAKALKVLKDHYELLQTDQTPMPGSLKGYKAQDASSGVLAMMDKIMGDSKALEVDSMKTEKQAQLDYEKYIADSNAALDASYATIASLGEERADKVEAKSDTEREVADKKGEVEGLSKVNTSLRNDCDFLLKFFGQRQEAMANEIEAAQKAKAILSGAK